MDKSKRPVTAQTIILTKEAVAIADDLRQYLEVETLPDVFRAGVKLLGWFLAKRKEGYDVALVKDGQIVKILTSEEPNIIG